jgi:hypothetical protein
MFMPSVPLQQQVLSHTQPATSSHHIHNWDSTDSGAFLMHSQRPYPERSHRPLAL